MKYIYCTWCSQDAVSFRRVLQDISEVRGPVWIQHSLSDLIMGDSSDVTDVTTDTVTSPATDIPNPNTGDHGTSMNSRTAYVLLQALLTPLVLFGNALILLAIRYSKSLRKVTYLFIGHLATADLLFGLTTCVRCIFIIISKMDDAYPCLASNAMVVASGGASMTGILLLCLDAYLSVRHSVTLSGVFTTRLAWHLIVVSWVFWLAFSVLGVALADPEASEAECYLGGGLYRNTYLVCLPLVYYVHFVSVLYLQLATVVTTRMRFKQLQRFSAVPRVSYIEVLSANDTANAANASEASPAADAGATISSGGYDPSEDGGTEETPSTPRPHVKDRLSRSGNLFRVLFSLHDGGYCCLPSARTTVA